MKSVKELIDGGSSLPEGDLIYSYWSIFIDYRNIIDLPVSAIRNILHDILMERK